LAGDIGTLVAVTHHPASWTNGTFYAHHNHRGDVILTRSGATTVGRYDYAAFGSLKSQTGPDVCRFTFSSKERDVSTGFSYYGYRFYAPQWQRWANVDPRAKSEHGVYSLLTLRGHLAPYNFCGNNPVSNIDDKGDFRKGIWEWIKEKAERVWEKLKLPCQAIWEALKYIVTGSETAGAVECMPNLMKIWK